MKVKRMTLTLMKEKIAEKGRYQGEKKCIIGGQKITDDGNTGSWWKVITP